MYYVVSVYIFKIEVFVCDCEVTATFQAHTCPTGVITGYIVL